MGKSYQYSERVAVTATEQSLKLPALRKLTVISDKPVYFSFDRSIDTAEDVLTVPYQGYSYGAGNNKIYLKTPTGTANVTITGDRQVRA